MESRGVSGSFFMIVRLNCRRLIRRSVGLRVGDGVRLWEVRLVHLLNRLLLRIVDAYSRCGHSRCLRSSMIICGDFR